jgi:uncharacterized protein (DUF488 family)
VAAIYTIGHSTRSLEEFLALLRRHRIEVLADVRAYPSSRKFPHFNQPTLETALSQAGIEYRWYQALGGRRHGAPQADSPNRGLRSPGFRNYADYMLSAEFRAAAADLRALARSRRLALMCAERLYWRCHRRLISDYLSAQGDEVLHIESADRLLPHQLTPGAHSENGEVTYPPEECLF